MPILFELELIGVGREFQEQHYHHQMWHGVFGLGTVLFQIGVVDVQKGCYEGMLAEWLHQVTGCQEF